ncbi:MAG: response regulator transcription factor [Bacteroidota bacterium]
MSSTSGNNITIGIVDDQRLFLKSLYTLINTFSSFNVILDALNADELVRKLDQCDNVPDILLVDVNMPVMEGPDVVKLVKKKYPALTMVALSMKDDDATIINMIRAGCSAYLVKDIHPDELEKALMEVYQKGYYNADAANLNYRRLISHANGDELVKLSDRERTFLQLSCSDLTYKQIASQMNLSIKTVDGYRGELFEKLNVQSRVGMALEAVRRGLAVL